MRTDTTAQAFDTELLNYVDGRWVRSRSTERKAVRNPATAETLAEVPLSAAGEVDAAVSAAAAAFREWRATPVTERVQPLFRLKALLEQEIDDVARTIVMECGKTFAEAKGEIRRGIENVEVACGAPTLMQGTNNEDVARGIDEHMIRQPLGVVAAVTPFNFPAMIPLWFLPYAVATGNAFVLKPSERVPLTSQALYRLIERAGFPDGVLSLVNGGRDTVEALCDHPAVRAISLVGSTPVARAVYARATAAGKRAQCQGGAKNPAVILPDADLEMTGRIMADSAFGCAGQRCLATSVAITVGPNRDATLDALVSEASERRVGFGLDEGVAMGPLITAESRERVRGLVDTGVREGGRLLLDGREGEVDGYANGYFLHPTVIDAVDPRGTLGTTEVFGPVLSVMHADTLDEAIALVNARSFGNQACLFTSSGAAARAFRHRADAGNIGINLGVAAPMAFFPFSGWNDSFFGDLHAQASHGVEFYTQTKVVIERWPDTWSRTF